MGLTRCATPSFDRGRDTRRIAPFPKGLNDAGYDSYVVGGAVRDAVQGKTPHDEDLTTNATPEEIKDALKDYGTFIDKGGEKFGTCVLLMNDNEIEITTFRKDGEYNDSRHPDSVSYAGSIEEDLSRRDFSINAIAWSPKDGFKDPYGGIKDIKDGVIKAVGDPSDRFKEDPLRMMRGVRFAVSMGAEIENNTLSAIKDNADLVNYPNLKEGASSAI